MCFLLLYFSFVCFVGFVHFKIGNILRQTVLNFSEIMAQSLYKNLSAIVIVAIVLLNFVLFSNCLKPVNGDKRIDNKLKNIGDLLFVMKSKKPAKLQFNPSPNFLK